MILSRQIARTSDCSAHDHPEFAVAFAPEFVPQPDVDWLLGFLQRQVEQGARFQPSDTLQIGWTLLKVQLRTTGDLALFEPDMKEGQIEFIDSVIFTLRHLREQKGILESVGLDSFISFPTMLQSALECSHYSDSLDFLMDRVEPQGNDSGWFFGCLEADHDHRNPQELRRVSLYEAGVMRPDLIPFLALPASSSVTLTHGEASVRHKGKLLVSRPGSFLRQRFPGTVGRRSQ